MTPTRHPAPFAGRNPRALIAGLATFCGWSLATANLHADFAPRPYRVDNFGEDLGAITTQATPSPAGAWVVFSRQGVVWQTDSSWRLVPPPAGVRLNLAVSHPRGLFAASRDGC